MANRTVAVVYVVLDPNYLNRLTIVIDTLGYLLVAPTGHIYPALCSFRLSAGCSSIVGSLVTRLEGVIGAFELCCSADHASV